MLPRKQRIREVALGLLILCVSSGIVAAEPQRSNSWHDGPISCYTCSSVEDCADGAGRLRACVNNDDQTCLVVFDEAGAVQQRGCSDAVADSQGAYCQSNPGHCPSCESSGCNDATALDQFVECVACDSLNDPDCVLQPAAVTTSRSCNGGCLTALRPIASDASRHHLVRSCLNDLDVDDREACAADEDNARCLPCTGAKCNVQAMPEERHSCYHCVDDCEDQEVHECAVFSEDDKCYVHYVQPEGVVDMGCLSDYESPDEVLALIRKKELHVCEDNNCNDFNKLPRPEECVSCSSAETEQCATLPGTVFTTERCSSIPYTQCYQRVAGGITERGCLAALEEDLFYDCLTGTDANCKICVGEDCNKDIVPADRPRCQRCDSTSDSRCQALPAALGVCPHYDAHDSCVAVYEGGETRRGCRSEFDCDASARNCQVCRGDGCNTLNLKKRAEEIYGVFQDLPINCYTCEGDECRGTEGVVRKCEGDPFQDCMTVMNSKSEVLSRGCEDTVLVEHKEHAEHCADHPHHCFRCKSNGCNVITDVDTPVLQCRYCDSAAQPDCLLEGVVGGATRRCVDGCVTALYERKSDPAVRDLVRTCFEDIEPDDRDACTPENNCVRCSDGDECNDVALPAQPAERLSCLHCNGADCGAPESRLCLGYDASDQCYIYFDNVTLSAVRMGCRSEYTRPQILAEIKQFFLCDGNDCNDYSALPEANFCFSCSSRSDENCAVAPSKLSARNRCQNLPHTECYTRITEDGHTERGCLQSLPTDVFVTCMDGAPTSICRICTESDCNSSVYPSGRRQCFRCNSNSDEACATAPTSPTAQPCPIYDSDDACVTKLEGNVTLRACASELQCAPGDGYKECRTCSGRNNCNNIDLLAEDIGPPGIFQQPPLNCYHCRGEEECSEEAPNVNVCSGDPLQTCTTAFAANGSVVARGCSAAIDPVCASLRNGACFECKSSGCNSATSRDDYVDCFFCDARDGEPCVFDATLVKRTRPCHKSCMTALYPRTDEPQPAYELIRTCLDDMDLDEREACAAGSDPDKCVACSGPLCNRATVGERKSCYQCVDDECLDPTASSCRATIEHEQCFIENDEAGRVVRQGCKSDYDPTELRLRVSAQRLWLCDEDDCNEVANQPEAQNCALCSSRTDPNCATAPDDITGRTLCPRVPYTQCYSRVLDGGHTERGCLSSLAGDVFYDCLVGSNTTACLACEGALCNSELFPIDRRSCHVCSSADSSSCETSPSAQQVCFKYSTDEQCTTLVTEQGDTERGCSSVLSCDPADGHNCELCDGDNCNAKNLRRKLDGRPGLWQPLPLTCHSCSGAADCEAPATDLCAETDYCMTVFAKEDGAVVYRGCSSAVELQYGDYCDLNSEHCFNCNSNECNSASSLDAYVDCIYCDSTRGSDCVSQPTAIGQRRKCHQHCMSALLPRNDNGAFELVRSCLDDKDAAERSVCLEGDSAQCAACDSAACNVDLLPPTRRSCLTCVGDDCMDPPSAECRQYDPNDGCFMLFDERGDITRLGCLSDLSYDFLAENALALHTCTDADDCNRFENVPQTTRCAVCSSATDPQCATHPDNTPESTVCSTRPNTQCYTRITSGGQTERGCVNSLDKASAATCLGGNSTACTTCHSDMCNTEVYPADRRQCQRCNSKDDPQCESSPAASSPCPIFEDGDVCSAKLVNGHTYRGCGSEFLCDPFDPQFCRMCADADNCNVVDLVAGNIGYPGQWTPAPLNCFVCSGGAECAFPDPTTLRKCEGNELQNCATVFDASGSAVKRSCSDELYADATSAAWCDANPDSCKFCKSSGCNVATSSDDFVDCLFCDGTSSADCISAPHEINRTRSCHRQCLTGLYPRSEEANGALELARGCLDDLDEDDREACASGTKEYCATCAGASCNTQLIPEQRHSCLHCVGEDCAEEESRQCRAFRPNEQCYTWFGEGVVLSKGCASEWENAELHANRRQLLLCDGSDCNSVTPPTITCSLCNSALLSSCATNPGEPVLSITCNMQPNTECYTRVNETGVTIRGCLADVSDDVFDDCLSGESGTCEVCASAKCNNGVFPEARRRCLRCDSDKDANCVSSPEQYSSVCRTYDAQDACVTRLEGDRLRRDCASALACEAGDKSCRRCSNSDNCNTIDLFGVDIGEPGKWQELPLNCLVCDGAAECADGGGTAHKCEGNNLQTCVTVFGAEGAVERRACSDEAAETHGDYCDQQPERCPGCKSSACNNADSLDVYIDCLFCDSALGAACVEAAAPGKRRCQSHCMVALYPRSAGGNDTAYEQSRSCLDDMDVDDREACLAGERELCVACSGDLCNTAAVPAERHSCYKCEGEACEDAEPQRCSAYLPHDQCYTLYDATHSIAGKGCRSEFESSVVEALVRQKQMRLCDGLNCNDPTAEPTPTMCSVCSSGDDARCATNPNLVANIERCSALPYTECYTRVSEDGRTHRGCLGSLEEDAFYGCLSGADGLCETCSGDKCNEIDVFPATRFRCEQCSSLSDPLCATAPNSNKVCPVYSAQDACVATLRDGITRRGCASSFSCDDPTDKRNCRVCSTPGCNTADLETVGPDGEPGRWQDVPLSCHTCVGAEECADDTAPGPLRVCTNNPYQNCATVFDAASGAVVRRGCSDAVAATHGAFCAANAEHCAACNSNGCNTASGLSEYVQCWACDTDASGACVNDLAALSAKRSCHKYCMTALYPLAEEADPAYGLTRSCLDDMDYDEREACTAGSDPDQCVACGTEGCNTALLPTTKRLSCNMCVGEECQAPQPAICPTYRPTDHCYIRYDEQRSVVAMGCRSGFSNAEADYLLREQRLFVCAGDNCNTYEAVPEPQTCRLCNSRTDENCATRPDRVSSTTRCEARPFTQCYSRVLSDGATERGCLASLYDDEFQGCLNGTASHCEVCSGDECNAALYPSPRLSCHICDSASDPGCETRPDSAAVCPKYADEDTCLTAYRNDVTYRGCSSSSAAAWGCSPTSSSAACSTCRGDACNTINLAKRQDDNHGMWQDLPLRCLTCASEAECASAATTTAATCANNNEQDCMTVFDAASGAVLRRGCEDAVEADFDVYCAANAGNCFSCKSNECNSATQRDSYVDCVYCNSHKDPECVWNPLSSTHATRSCQGGCMAALFPSDSSSAPAYDLIRTCLDDKEAAAQSNCSAGSDPLCRACVGAQCNVYDLPEDRLSCLICEGASCEEPQSALCPLYKPDDKCFIWFDDTNSVAEMGCTSKLRGLDLETVVKTKRILLCDGADCNSLDRLDLPQKCAACDSRSDVNCAIRATDVGTFETCTHQPYTSCYSKLVADGSTVRGCLADLPADDFAACVLGTDANCGTCKGDGCNREVFPADRQQCYVCTTEDDDDCESFPTQQRPCPVVNEREACVSALSGNETVRGCSSELKCDTSDSSTCRACFSTGCNGIDLRNKLDDGYHGVWQALPLRCHTCAGDHCHDSLGPALNCTRNAEQDCATVFEADGTVRRRGCSDDVDDYEDVYCRLHPHLCNTCKSNECNDAWELSEFVDCAFCDSLNDPLCIVNPENANFAVRSCRKECMVAMRGQQVIRSCLDDKELFVQNQCRTDDGGETCASCTQDDCNKFAFPADRLKCHVCDGASCTSSSGQYCTLYEKDDFCFAKYEGGAVELMGCASAENASDIADWTAQRKLYRCEGNDCNDLTKLPSVGVCVACDSSKTPNCAQNPTAVRTTEACEAPSNECVTRTNSVGHTLRGCLNALDESEQNCVASGTCAVCTGDRCNNEVYPAQRRQCHICNSVADKECAKSPNSPFICPVYAANDQCVSKNTNGYIERGCASELSCDVNDKKYCQICDGNTCNTGDVSDAVGQLAAGSLLWSLLVAAATIVAMRRH